MKKALVLVGLLLLASVSALGGGLTHANYQTWFQNASAECYFGITNAGLVDLYNGARFDNVTSATTLTITETNISLVGATSVTGAFSASSITGYAIGTNVQAYDADLTTWAGITPSANVQSFSAAADYSAMRTLLSLVPGTNVLAYNADVQTIATAQGTATNEGVLFCTTFKIDYAQTSSQTVGIVPANAYVTKVEIAVTTPFNGSGTDLLDVGISGGAADAYVNDLDLSTAGYITAGGVFSALGSVGGADRTITCLYVDQNSNASAGSALVNVYWRMGTIGD